MEDGFKPNGGADGRFFEEQTMVPPSPPFFLKMEELMEDGFFKNGGADGRWFETKMEELLEDGLKKMEELMEDGLKPKWISSSMVLEELMSRWFDKNGGADGRWFVKPKWRS